MLDSYGRYSTEFVKAISTETYILPSVTSVTPTTKYNQISVSVVGANGTNNISKYYYSINDGAYTERTNSSYTFTGLNEKTNYSIKVKVVDTLGRESNVYSLSVTTDAYVPPRVTNVSTSSTSSSITINVSASGGTGNVVKYYYSKDNGSNYVESTSSSYTFSNLTSGATFYVKVYVKDSNNRESSVFATSVATKNRTLVDYVKAQYTGTQGDNGIYYHDSSLANGAGDNSYRYAGENPNNYVCFGSTTTPCPADNLYRIIGVFGDKVKLIKSTSVGNKAWDINDSDSSTWSTSSLNTYLNNEFITTFDETTKGKIEKATWKVGGNTRENIEYQPAKTAYQNEVVQPITDEYSTETEYSAKVGLMYASDYGFAAAPSAWTSILYDYDGAAIKKCKLDVFRCY